MHKTSKLARSNPSGFFGLPFSLNDIALLGAAAFLLTTDAGRALIKTAFPSQERPEDQPGSIVEKAEVVGWRRPTPAWWQTMLAPALAAQPTLYRGAPAQTTVMVNYRGAGGPFKTGIIITGQDGKQYQEWKQDISLLAANYSGSLPIEFTLSTDAPVGIYRLRFWLRSAAGATLVDHTDNIGWYVR